MGAGAPGAAKNPKWLSGSPKLAPKETQERLQKRLGDTKHTTQEEIRAEKPRREDASALKTQKTRPEARQDNKLTNGLSKPLSPEPFARLQLTSRAFNTRVHSSMYIYIYILDARRGC